MTQTQQPEALRLAEILEQYALSPLREVAAELRRQHARIEELEVIWKPVESLTLSERSAAYASLRGNGLSIKTALREGMQMKPREIQRAMDELLEDQLRKAFTEPNNGPTPLAKAQNGNQTKASKVGNNSETLVKAREEGRKANQ